MTVFVFSSDHGATLTVCVYPRSYDDMILNEEGGIEFVAEDDYDGNISDPDAENYYTHDYGDEPPSSDEVGAFFLLC